MVAVISVNAYPFSAFSNLTYHLEDTRVVAFWLHCAAKDTKLRSSDNEASTKSDFIVRSVETDSGR